MKKTIPNQKDKFSPFTLIIYQKNAHQDGRVDLVELQRLDLNKNDSKSNLKQVKQAAKAAKTDGEVYGIVIRNNEENNFQDAWQINPYNMKQFRCGIQVRDSKTGQIRYEGDDGGGYAQILWEETSEGKKALARARKTLSPDYLKTEEQVLKKRKRVPKDQTITIRLEPEEAKRLEELAELATTSTGVETTKSWVLRESLKIAYSAMKKKYEEM